MIFASICCSGSSSEDDDSAVAVEFDETSAAGEGADVAAVPEGREGTEGAEEELTITAGAVIATGAGGAEDVDVP